MFKAFFIICLVAGIAGSLTAIFDSSPQSWETEERRYSDFYDPESYVSHVARHTAHRDSLNAVMGEVFDLRKQDYQANSATTHSTLQALAAFMVVGLLVLFYRPHAIQLPVIGMQIPETLVYLFVSIGIIFFWIQFGLSMNASIDSRYALHYLTDIKEYDGCHKVAYVYSSKNSFVDNGIIDNWCGVYLPQVFDRKPGPFQAISYLGLFGIFGVFFGAIHAVCFILVAYLNRRSGGTVLTWTLGVFTLLMLLLATVCFVLEFDYSLLFMSWIWLVAAAGIWLWKKFGVAIADRIERKKEQPENGGSA